MNTAQICIVAAVVNCLGNSAAAQSQRSETTAANGVVVSISADDFASRYEYSAPIIRAGDGFVLVARIEQGTSIPTVNVQGSFVYSGEWRRYSSALFRGGDAAPFQSTGRDVGRCHSSRYSRPSCTLSESFVLNLTPQHLQNYAREGVVQVQIRGDAGVEPVIFDIPVSYFEAVNEVADRRKN